MAAALDAELYGILVTDAWGEYLAATRTKWALSGEFQYDGAEQLAWGTLQARLAELGGSTATVPSNGDDA